MDESKYVQLDGGRIGLRHFPDPNVRRGHVVCFPHAGAQSLAFARLADKLGGLGLGCSAIDPPGHGWARGEPVGDMAELVEGYVRHLPMELLTSSVLFGHSMGAYVALGVTLELQKRGLAPVALVLSAARPPHRRPEYDQMAEMPEQHLLDALLKLGGVPESCVPVFGRFAPAIRADFRALETGSPPSERCETSTLILGGMLDPFCLPEHVIEWDRYLTEFQTRWIEGGHLFVDSHPEHVAQRLNSFLDSLHESRRGPAPRPVWTA